MAAPPTGLDISSSALVAVTLKRKGKAYVVDQRAEGDLPSGLIVDGEVHDVDALADAIKSFWATAGLKDKNVSIGLATQRCVVRVVEMPRIKNKKQLRDAISFEVSDHLPIPLEDAVWDFHTVASWKDDGGVEKQRHVIVMTYKDSVDRYRDAIAAAGLKLVRIDLSAFALMRAGLPAVNLVHDVDGDEATEQSVALIDIGPSVTNLVVSRGGVCQLNRLVSFGTQHFVQTLAEQFGWSTEDALRVAFDAGIQPLGGVEQPDDQYADARRIMQYVCDQFAAELKTSFDYYGHSIGQGSHISRVIVAGEGSLLRGIEYRFANELSIPTSVLDASPRLDPASVDELGARHARFGTAIGLAIQEAA